MNPEILEAKWVEIQKNPDALRAFLHKMPKGGDIHHHALGAIWAEDILQKAAEWGLWVDLQTGQLYRSFVESSELVSAIWTDKPKKSALIDQWSVRNFDENNAAPHIHFFDIFAKIEPAFVGHEIYWLEKIAEQAAKENIQYIETLIEVPSERNLISAKAINYSGPLDNATDFQLFLDWLWKQGLSEHIEVASTEIEEWAEAMQRVETEKGVLIQFQLYAIRVFDAPAVFAQLALCFELAQKLDSVVGVNLVAPEHHPTSLQDYSLHMQFCKFFKELYPSVNLALHAGELTAHLASKEHLEFHIKEALAIGGAQRIGHGVDLLSESNYPEIIEFMSSNLIALEVLLESNDFILGVRKEAHPILSYLNGKVPIVLATDDPGLLRCNLAGQFFWLLQNYSGIDYQTIKKLIFNSLEYSFLPESRKKQQIELLNEKKLVFEQNISSF